MFDFHAHFCHPAPMETHLPTPGQRPEGQARFPFSDRILEAFGHASPGHLRGCPKLGAQMILHSLRSDRVEDVLRSSMTLEWEDCARESAVMWFEAPYREGSAHPDRNPFLTASYALAAHHGERHVRLDGPVSPLLRDGLSVVAGWWQRWGLLEQAVPRVEAQGQPEPRGQERGRIASALLSGGVDSLHMLAHNRRAFPTDHPHSIKQVILVHGFDIPSQDFTNFELAKEHLRPIIDDLGVDLVTVRTNLKEIDSGHAFWREMYHGPALSAVGQIASARPGYVYIAATYDIPNMAPHGSHPAIDPALSTERVTIVHSGETFSRLQKVIDLGDGPRPYGTCGFA